MESGRPGKRVRVEETFFNQAGTIHDGSFLKVSLCSGIAIRSKGWPWAQMCIRGVLGRADRVEKASMLADGSLLVKTKNQGQTDKFLNAKHFGEEECTVTRDRKMNTSKGTINAFIDLCQPPSPSLVTGRWSGARKSTDAQWWASSATTAYACPSTLKYGINYISRFTVSAK